LRERAWVEGHRIIGSYLMQLIMMVPISLEVIIISGRIHMLHGIFIKNNWFAKAMNSLVIVTILLIVSLLPVKGDFKKTQEKVNGPDIVICGVYLSESHPIAGQDVLFTIVLSNIGQTNASNFNVSLILNHKVISTTYVDSLCSGEIMDVNFTWKAVEGKYSLYVNVSNMVENEELIWPIITVQGKDNNFPLLLVSISVLILLGIIFFSLIRSLQVMTE